MRRGVDPRVRPDVHAELRRAEAISIREVAGAVGEELAAADDAGALDELEQLELDVWRGAELERGRGALRREARPRNDRVPFRAQVLVEDAQVPAVLELHHAPLVPVAGALPVLMAGEILDGPLAVDPTDLALDRLRHVAPRELAAHPEPALEIRERLREAEEHHLAAEHAAAERRRWTVGIDVERERHRGAMVVAAAQVERPRERDERAGVIPLVHPRHPAGIGGVAKREVAARVVDLVATPDARRLREVVVGVRAVVAARPVVERERVEARAEALPEDAHVGDDRHERVLAARRPAAEEAVDEVRRHAELGVEPVDVGEREPLGIAPVGNVRIALPVGHRAADYHAARAGCHGAPRRKQATG